MKATQYIVSAAIAAFLILCYFFAPKPVEFSPTVSVIVIILLAVALFYIFLRTFAGHFVGRRTVFIFVGVALLLPFFMQFQLPLQISPEVRSVFDALEELPPGSKVLTAFDFDPPSAPELQPMADAFMKYAFERRLKIIMMGLWPQGPDQANQAVQAAFEYNPEFRETIKYGEDYVNLGFQAGNEFVILRMGESFAAMFPTDLYNTPYDSIPVLRNVRGFADIDFGMNFSAGKPGTQEWVQIAVDRYQLPLAAANTAVQAPMAYPWLKAGQLVGLMGGMAGGAEFEKLTGKQDKATTFLLSQSFAHMVVIIFIIIGNAAFLREKRKKK
ncbi:MAG: hypothetical protein ABII79_12345 [bacterium]